MFTEKTKMALSVTIFFLLMIPLGSFSYKILVVPYGTGFNSRLLNIQKIADILAEDGHEVTVLMNTKTMSHKITKYAKTILFQVPEEQKDITQMEVKRMDSWNFVGLMQEILDIEYAFGKAMMNDNEMLTAIYNENFDLVFADLNHFSSYILVSHLNITTIWYENFLLPGDCNVFFPIIPSITCAVPGIICQSYEMDFKDRLKNFLYIIFMEHYLLDSFLDPLVKIAEQSNFDLKTPISDVSKNKIIAVNSHYALDTPMPTMPHIFLISGLFHKQASPLNKPFSDIVEASQPNGVILLSFGTMIAKFDPAKAEMLARVFGRFPQSVIWRFAGEPPKSLKKNTHLVKWFPQNDLLADPAIKLFITHCGISSTFESAFHGVPVIAMPLFAEQADNADKLTKRVKNGVKLDFDTLTEKDIERSIKEVLSNPIYKENAMKISYLLNERLVSPKEELRHLVNFTIKSGGAPHLFHPYAVNMSWFHFYGMDVIMFLLTISCLFVLMLSFMMKLIVKYLFKKLFCGPDHKKPKNS